MRPSPIVSHFGSSKPNPRVRKTQKVARAARGGADEFEALALARTDVMNSGATLHESDVLSGPAVTAIATPSLLRWTSDRKSGATAVI